MPTRLYPLNQAAPYSPATIRGTWNSVAAMVTRKLGTAKVVGDTNANVFAAETSSTNPYEVGLLRFVSDGLPSAKSFTTSDTLNLCLGKLESAAGMNAMTHITAYVTAGDSDTIRDSAYLLQDNTGVNEWPASAAFEQDGGGITLTGNVNALAGDRIVIIFGYAAQNSKTNSYTGTLYYGAASTMTDGVDTDVNVTTKAGWFEFSIDNLFTPDDLSVENVSDSTGTASDTPTVTTGAGQGYATDSVGTITDIPSAVGGDLPASTSEPIGVGDTPILERTEPPVEPQVTDPVGTGEATSAVGGDLPAYSTDSTSTTDIPTTKGGELPAVALENVSLADAPLLIGGDLLLSVGDEPSVIEAVDVWREGGVGGVTLMIRMHDYKAITIG